MRGRRLTLKPDIELAIMLESINQDALTGGSTPDNNAFALLARANVRLASAGSNGVGRLPPEYFEQLRAVIRAFRHGPADFRALRLVCHGCSSYCETDQYVLMADEAALQQLFGAVAGYSHEPRPFRRLYDGLLRAYLNIDRQADWFRSASATNGNEAIRAFLAGTFHIAEPVEPMPDWVMAVRSYPELLSPRPGDRFAGAWLAGETAEFKDVTQRLGLTGASWLASETILAALNLAVAVPDRLFVNHISALLSAAGEQRFQSLRDEIYAGLLSRYSSMASPAIHAELRDALVGAWKNPWLARNGSAWGRVPEKARQMVAGWLKLELIHQFFEVLSDKAWQDTGRFEFWRTYHNRMDQVNFGLSRSAFRSNDPDFRKFKSDADGLIFELANGTSKNHAFIMCMSETVVVEFSEKGNAARQYRRDQLPFDLSQGVINIGDLRQEQGHRMLHASAKGQTWQERFAQALEPAAAREPTIFDISMFARRSKIEFADLRPQGGNIWLYTSDANAEIVSQLTAWSFQYRPSRGWWRPEV